MNAYDIGDTVRLSVVFTVASVATDPTTVIARVQTPSGTTVYEYGIDAALVKDAVGSYHIDANPSVAGNYIYRFEGTGSASAATEASFTVRLSAFY